LGQVKQLNPIWNEFFELEVEDPNEQKVVGYVIDEAAAQEFQLLGCTHIALQVGKKIICISMSFIEC
jgi:Ca2+-dependent lipid-binding protein